MIRYVLPSLALAALASPAMAQSVDTAIRQLEISAVATPACLIRGPQNASGVNASYQNNSSSSGQITIAEMVDPSTAQPRASSVNLALPVVCNSAHTLSVVSVGGGLRRVVANQRNQAAGGFAEMQPYTMSARWAGQTASRLSSVRGGLSIVSSDAGAGLVEVGIAVAAGNTPLVAGAYADSIVINLRAAN